jgi:hypothetical protein
MVRAAALLMAMFLAVSPVAGVGGSAFAQNPALPPATLSDGTYKAERGYNRPRASCPAKIEIMAVKIAAGTIEFESGGSRWFGSTNDKNGVIRIETAGISPRPTAALLIRGHFTNAQLFSAVCGAGYFRIIL